MRLAAAAVAVARAIPLVFCQRLRQRDDARCGASRIRLCRKRQEPADVLDVCRAHRSELLVGTEVFVAVGHAEARLRDDDGVDVGTLWILRDANGQRGANATLRRPEEGQ